jgi:type IV secretory pathway TrbL component
VNYTKRLHCLGYAASLGVTAIRHGVIHNWKTWDALWTIGEYFVANWISIFVYIIVTAGAISYYSKFYLGYEDEIRTEKIQYYLTMAVLVASILIFIGMHWIPTDIDGVD